MVSKNNTSPCSPLEGSNKNTENIETGIQTFMQRISQNSRGSGSQPNTNWDKFESMFVDDCIPDTQDINVNK